MQCSMQLGLPTYEAEQKDAAESSALQQEHAA
jgi:hypothetical protein